MVVLETTYLGLYHLKNEFEETYTEAKNHKIDLETESLISGRYTSIA